MQFNKGQYEAINTLAKRALILAGAGTGKTSVIINRIAKLINDGVNPSKIITTTFTNKAAKELQERLHKIVGEAVFSMYCGTFHRISTQILRKHYDKVGLNQDFQILTDDDQRRLVKGFLKELGKDEKPKVILDKISKYKETGKKKEDDLFFYKIYEMYNNMLIENSLLDYSDLIKHAVFLFKNYSEIADSLCDHILVDEYQDINGLQYEWITLLSKNAGLFCVGDEDQSIYAFRGANIEYIQRFTNDFADAQVIKLEENYRSCSQILRGAVNLISKNNKKFEKNLIAANEQLVGFIKVNKTFNEYEEAELIAKRIAFYKSEYPEYSIGVLVRTNMQIAYIEHALVEAQISYDIASGRKFYEKKEVQDLVCYLRAIYSENDFLAFTRIINTPKRGIGEAKLNLFLDAMKSLQCNFEMALTTLMDQLPRTAKEKCKIFLMQIQLYRRDAQNISLVDLVDLILKDTNYIELEEIKDKKNIEAMKDHLKKYTSLKDFLENLQFSVEDSNDNFVQIMTIHAAKGLEFDVVLAPGWEENVFPSMLSKNLFELEEERRLAYVAVTRAKMYFEIFHVVSRKINGRYSSQMPSRFIFDL